MRTQNKQYPKQKSVSCYSRFLSNKNSVALRAEFEKVYCDPRRTPAKRFQWDHWHLENQYRMHRTPARDFFSARLYNAFKNQMIQFGQTHLGCHSISEPWLSYYTEGDEQRLHTDSPHGPWAFVYSLTPTFNFKGGETILLKDSTLNYWSNFKGRRGHEWSDLVTNIQPHFNQLLVFDPRIPHGVNRVSGTDDPIEGRLVIHGWFVQPEPFIVGSLSLNVITKILNEEIGELLDRIQVSDSIFGTTTWRLEISARGIVVNCELLTDSLIDRNSKGQIRRLHQSLKKQMRTWKFPASRGMSYMVLPLIFA